MTDLARPVTDRYAAPLLVAFLVAITAFAAGTIVTEYFGVSAQEQTAGILRNAIPSIQDVATARVQLRRIERVAGELVGAGGADGTDPRGAPAARGSVPLLEAEIAHARADFDEAVARYLTPPVYEDEVALTIALRKACADLDEGLASLLATARAGDEARARFVLDHAARPALDRIDELFELIIQSNASNAARLAREADDLEARSTRRAILFDVVATAVAMGAALAALRVVRRHDRLMESRAVTLGRRADDLDVFAARVAHDILSPLGASAAAFGLARKLAPGDAKLADVLGRGERSLARVRHIVDAHLDFARAATPPGSTETTDVQLVYEEVADDVRARAEVRGIAVVVEAGSALEVPCARGVLLSAVSNLANNAVKYMGDRPTRRVVFRALLVGDRVRCEVEDTGPGLPEGMEARVFEPYVRGPGDGPRRVDGIGLGLATVKRLVEAHGGTLGVASRAGEGCVFWFELPRVLSSTGLSAMPEAHAAG